MLAFRVVTFLLLVSFPAQIFGQSTQSDVEDLRVPTLIEDGSPDITIFVTTKKLNCVPRIMAFQKRGKESVFLEMTQNGCPLVYSHDGVVYFGSAQQPGQMEVLRDIRVTLSIKVDGNGVGPKLGVNFTRAQEPAQIGNHVHLDPADIMNGYMRAGALIRNDHIGGATFRTAHSVFSIQQVPSTKELGEVTFLSLSDQEAVISAVYVIGIQPRLPVISLVDFRANLSYVVDGSFDSLDLLNSRSWDVGLASDPAFRDRGKKFGETVGSFDSILSYAGLAELQAIAVAAAVADQQVKDPKIRGKVENICHAHQEKVIEEVDIARTRMLRNSDLYKCVDRVYDQTRVFSGELSTMLQPEHYFEFVKEYLGHPVSTSQELGDREIKYLFLREAQICGASNDVLGIVAAASLDACSRRDQIDEDVERFITNMDDYQKEVENSLVKWREVCEAQIDPSCADQMRDHFSKLPKLDNLSGLVVGDK